MKFRTVLIQTQALQRCVAEKDTFSLNWDLGSIIWWKKGSGKEKYLHQGKSAFIRDRKCTASYRAWKTVLTIRGGLNCSINFLRSLKSWNHTVSSHNHGRRPLPLLSCPSSIQFHPENFYQYFFKFYINMVHIFLCSPGFPSRCPSVLFWTLSGYAILTSSMRPTNFFPFDSTKLVPWNEPLF